MNLFLAIRRAVFLPWGTILKHLEGEHTGTPRDCLTLWYYENCFNFCNGSYLEAAKV
jgi:hypothetical protein